MLVPVTFVNCVTHFKGCKVKKDKKNDPLHHLLQAYAILYSFAHIALQGRFGGVLSTSTEVHHFPTSFLPGVMAQVALCEVFVLLRLYMPW